MHIPGGKSASSWPPLPSPPPQNDIGSGSDIDGIISLLYRLLFHPVQSDHDCVQGRDQQTEALIGQCPVILKQVQPALDRCCDRAAVSDASRVNLGLTEVPTRGQPNTARILLASSMPNLGHSCRHSKLSRNNEILNLRFFQSTQSQEVARHRREVPTYFSRLEEIFREADLHSSPRQI